jgi:hypothetical protein
MRAATVVSKAGTGMASKSKSPPTPSSAVGNLRLYYPILSSCMMERSDFPQEETKNKKKKTRFYDAVIQIIDSNANIDMALCEFAAGQKLADKKIIEIKATYFVGISLDGAKLGVDDKNKLFIEMTQTSVWPMFRDLFIHIGSQASEELPLLPTVPRVRLKANEDKTEKESDS